MASTDARPVPRKNAAFRFYFAVRKNDGTLITSWSGADSEVSIDGAGFSDCTNEATEIGSSGCGYIDLTSSEMNGDAVMYKLTVTNTGALPLVVTFFPEEAGDYRADMTHISGDATAADNAEAFFDGTGYAGTNNVIPTVTTLTGHTPQTGDAYARLGAPAGASVSADTAAIKAAVDVIDDYVDGIVADILAGTVEGSITVVQALRLQLAALAGKLSGAATTTVSIRDTGDTKNRIVATVDADGNRSAVTLDGT